MSKMSSSISPTSSLHSSPMKRVSFRKVESTTNLRPFQLFKSQAMSKPDKTLFSSDFEEANWNEIKSEYVKKKAKFIFFVDRFIRLFDNGYIGYYTSGRKELKAYIPPNHILAC